MMEKEEFITKLLNHQGLKANDRERILLLSCKELTKNSSTEILEIKTKLSVMEGRILKALSEGKVKEINVENDPPKNTFKPPTPKETMLFLSNFRESEAIKFLTHDFKDPFTPPIYEDFINSVRIELDVQKKKYPNIPMSLIERIENFIFEPKPNWYITNGNEKKYFNTGWSALEFKNWYLDRYNDWKINPSIKVHPKYSSKWNSEMIEPFKKSVQIREGYLLTLINECINHVFTEVEKSNKYDISINKTNFSNADFYTDVNFLRNGIIHILESIKDNVGYNFKINISFDSSYLEVYSCIKIEHIDSVSSKLLNENKMGGSFNSIFNDFKNLCLWAIEYTYNEKNYSRYILYDSKLSNNKNKEIDYKPKGFTHLLIFY